MLFQGPVWSSIFAKYLIHRIIVKGQRSLLPHLRHQWPWNRVCVIHTKRLQVLFGSTYAIWIPLKNCLGVLLKVRKFNKEILPKNQWKCFPKFFNSLCKVVELKNKEASAEIRKIFSWFFLKTPQFPFEIFWHLWWSWWKHFRQTYILWRVLSAAFLASQWW